jgi:hypothetical protein
MKRSGAAGDTLHDKSCVFINQNRHKNQESRKTGKKSGNHEAKKQIRKIPGFLVS